MVDTRLLEQRLARAERRSRWSILVTLIIGVVLLVSAATPQDDIIRARAIVITDADGRDRIVLGAPLSAGREGPQFTQAVGMIVLDSLGKLNVAVGANNPLVLEGGATGMRRTESAGFTIYDPRGGHERGGMGVFADGRANVCLDYGSGTKEAACMMVEGGDEYAAFLLNGTPGEDVYDRVAMFVGADGAGSIKVFGGKADRGGVMLRAGSGPASVTVYDSTHAVIGNLAQGLER
jgi:hypothetical protein